MTRQDFLEVMLKVLGLYLIVLGVLSALSWVEVTVSSIRYLITFLDSNDSAGATLGKLGETFLSRFWNLLRPLFQFGVGFLLLRKTSKCMSWCGRFSDGTPAA